MSRRLTIITLSTIITLGWFIFYPTPTKAAADNCFCFSDVGELTADSPRLDMNNVFISCVLLKDVEKENCKAVESLAREKTSNTNMINIRCEETKYTTPACEEKADAKLHELIGKSKKSMEARQKNLGFLGRATPDCAFKDLLVGECRDISVFVLLIIQFTRAALGIVGAFALVFFMYGGFVLILSQGSAEKIKQGTDAMVAALIGLFIVFIAYMFIKFVGNSIGVNPDFNLL